MPKKYWSARITKESNALDLEEGVFTWKNPKSNDLIKEVYSKYDAMLGM